MRFLRGELVDVDVLTPLADLLPGRDQLAAGAFGECLGPGRYEDLVRCPQLVPGVDAPVLAAQPLPVDQVSAGEGHDAPAAAQLVDRLLVEELGFMALADQGPRARLDAPGPRGGAWLGGAGKPLDRIRGAPGVTAARRRLGQLDQAPVGEAEFLRIRASLVGRGQRIPVAAEAVVEHRAGVLSDAQSHALVPHHSAALDRLDELDRLGPAAPPARQGHRAVGGQVVARRLGDRRRLLDERSGRGELSRVQMQADPLSQRDRQHAESADIADELEIPHGELVPAVVIP